MGRSDGDGDRHRNAQAWFHSDHFWAGNRRRGVAVASFGLSTKPGYYWNGRSSLGTLVSVTSRLIGTGQTTVILCGWGVKAGCIVESCSGKDAVT